MRIRRQEIAAVDFEIGKVTSPPARHQDLFSNLVRALQDQYLASAITGSDRAHQAGCASAHYNDVVMFQQSFPGAWCGD